MPKLSKAQVYAALAGGGVTGELARIMAGGAWAESGWDTDAEGDVQASGYVCSFGLLQINRCGGLGVGYTERELRDPAVQVAIMRPEYERAYDRWSVAGYTGAELASYVCRYAERPFDYENPNSVAARGYEAGYQMAAPDAGGPVQYDPDQPREIQIAPWACSIRTATWMLKSIGVDTDAGRLQGLMVPQYVTPDLGLLTGDGSGLAEVLAVQSGQPAGHQWVTWADLQQMPIGQQPFGLGGIAWNHWVGVRRWQADGALALANPADGWMGVGETLTEADFARLGPFACVWIEVAAGGDDLSAEERAELDDLRNYIGGLTADVLKPGLAAIEAAASGQRGKRWDTVRAQVQAIRDGSGVTP